MKNTAVVNHQTSLQDALQNLTPKTRIWVGLFACAILAHLAPILVLVAVGKWANEVLVFAVLAMTVLILMLQNLLGNKLKHIWLINSIAAFLYTAHTFHMMTLTSHNLTQGLETCWATFFYVILACLLNAALFIQFKKMADLK